MKIGEKVIWLYGGRDNRGKSITARIEALVLEEKYETIRIEYRQGKDMKKRWVKKERVLPFKEPKALQANGNF
jgi:hypothetical protein